MEANFFRHLTAELGPALLGLRLEKLYSPLDDAWTLVLEKPKAGQALGRPNLLLQAGPKGGLLFLSDHRPANPDAPPMAVMWLRKRALGRRLLGFAEDWPRRRLAFALSPRQGVAENFLVLDLKDGLGLKAQLPDDFGRVPDWPMLTEILADPDLWQRYPQITPPLRRTLKSLPPDQAQALYDDIRQGQAQAFHLPADLSAEPLPWPPASQTAPAATRTYASALDAAQDYGVARLFSRAGAHEVREQVQEERAQAKRLKKALARLDDDHSRHQGLMALGLQAETLLTHLHEFKDKKLPPRLRLEHPEHGPVEVELDPRLTASANLERLYRLASKGKRGLAHVKARREALLSASPAPSPDLPAQANPASPPKSAPLPKRLQTIALRQYRSSDGLTILRGKSDKANHELLSKTSSPFDLWFHVEGGPGAHVILRRDHPGQEVPRQSLLEAATLAALSSYRATDSKAEVIVALVKDVRKSKGAPHGQVTVDARLETLLVTLDPTLETKLKVTAE